MRRLSSGQFAYITRGIDRIGTRKIHMEDMCQLTERMTEQKYNGFHEQILFSFLTGTADMHLKNFSLIDRPDFGYVLSPAYDMVASALVVEGDKEELELTLNGKKKNISFLPSEMKVSYHDMIDERAVRIF
ncbi:MAG: HipA domain-containing protein [Bacteroidales bacterium]|jgi:serine/threonine-protein kinase HipA|nr:HipA domain-containing protein [Bacteroidales bacterium]